LAGASRPPLSTITPHQFRSRGLTTCVKSPRVGKKGAQSDAQPRAEGEWTINVKVILSGKGGCFVSGTVQVQALPTDSVETFFEKGQKAAEAGGEHLAINWPRLSPFHPSSIGSYDSSHAIIPKNPGPPDCTWDPSKPTIAEAGLHDGATLAGHDANEMD